MKRIPLGDAVALIDDEDYERVAQHPWYVMRCAKNRTTYGRNRHGFLHRYILGLEKGDVRCVDHINGDGLDCRRSNMRLCTRAQNARNRRNQQKRLYGVTRSSSGWVAAGRIMGQRPEGWPCAWQHCAPHAAALERDVRCLAVWDDPFQIFNFASLCRDRVFVRWALSLSLISRRAASLRSQRRGRIYKTPASKSWHVNLRFKRRKLCASFLTKVEARRAVDAWKAEVVEVAHVTWERELPPAPSWVRVDSSAIIRGEAAYPSEKLFRAWDSWRRAMNVGFKIA